MPCIRPVSDLRNNFADISKEIHETNEPIFLTKNGYGSNARTGELTPPGMNFLDSWNKSLENILSHYKF